MAIIGKMDKRVDLQELVKTADGQGGFTSTWSTAVTVWAEFKKPTAVTAAVDGAMVSDMTREIGIRFRLDVKKGWRVVWGTRIFEVLHTYDYGRTTTILVCREVVK